jgi:hypothetical protein
MRFCKSIVTAARLVAAVAGEVGDLKGEPSEFANDRDDLAEEIDVGSREHHGL